MLAGQHVVNFSRVDPAHAELEIPILASCKVRRTLSAAGCSSRNQASSAHESTTLECGIFSGEFGTVFRFQGLGKAPPSPHHALHGAPVGVIADQPFHDQSLPLHV